MSAGTISRKNAKAASRPLVRTPSYEEAFARLQFLVDHGSRLGLLLGESGSGKTTLLESVHQDLRRASCLTALVNVAGLEPEELLWSIAVKLQATVESHWNLFQLWRALNDRFAELRYLREQAVVLVDDVGLASSDTLMHLYRLTKCDNAADARLSLILSGTPSAVGRLGRHLLDLVELKIELNEWNAAETRALIESAPSEGRPVRFSGIAVERVHVLAGGLPRSILRLAGLAQLAASASGSDVVDAEIVESVYEELGVHVRSA
ncbi:MAG: ATP-binding protein [Pirellulales bacterium]